MKIVDFVYICMTLLQCVEVLGIDTVPPVISNCPESISDTVPMGTPTLVVTWIEPTATDDSGIKPERMQTHLPEESFPVGTTNVIYLFQNEARNQALCTFDVTGNINCIESI